MLIVHLRLIQSALGQKLEAKPMGLSHRERSQGRAAMGGHEVACLPGEAGLHMGQSQRRASPFLAKSVLSAYFPTGLGGAYAVSVAAMALVLPAITSCEWFVRPTWCDGRLLGTRRDSHGAGHQLSEPPRLLSAFDQHVGKG